MPPKTAPTALTAPHSWPISEWTERAPHVHPNTTERARWLVRVHRDDLLREGAIARVGRELIVFGARYTRWLEKQASRVADYPIAPNRAEASERTA